MAEHHGAGDGPLKKKRKSPKPKQRRPKPPKATSAVASRSIGRPTLYDVETAERILKRLADGETVRAICRDAGMPAESTVRLWATNADHPFAAQYDRARKIGYECMADELLDICDDSRNDWVERENKNGATVQLVDEEAISRSRLRVDTRKWLLSKCLPKFADKLQVGGKDGGPIQVAHSLTNLERARRIALLFETATADEKANGKTTAIAGLLGAAA